MEKSIVEKLKLDQYNAVAILDLPAGANYFTSMSGYSTELSPNSTYDLIFAFVLDAAAMHALVAQVIAENRLKPKGYLFMAYPKKGNLAYPAYIHRDELFTLLGSDEDGYIGSSVIKFARMVGLDDVFTVVGLKEDAAGKGKPPAARPSQRVEDYVAFIPHIEQDLQDTPSLLAAYQALTPGYRKDWARYVYSTKQEATRAERRAEMKAILGAGFKSKELYRQAKAREAAEAEEASAANAADTTDVAGEH